MWELPRNAEIPDFKIIILGYEHIAGFYISVDNLFTVNEEQSLAQLHEPL